METGGYLLPYLDVPKDHPHFKVCQRIGATGILKGTEMNLGWENQTWSFPEKELSQLDLGHALSIILAFEKILPPVSPKNDNILLWLIISHSSISPNKPEPDWIKNTKSLSEFLGVEVEPMANISRGNFAVLLDAMIDPFNN